uniref:Ion channel n=1 Tax=Panagrellus redivivus TaxID=6233 RepID=A0A7E4ZZY6_PANRE
MEGDWNELSPNSRSSTASCSNSDNTESPINLRPRNRHVAFAAEQNESFVDDDNKSIQYVEDDYYVDGPGMEPIFRPVFDAMYPFQAEISARRKSIQVLNNKILHHHGKHKDSDPDALIGPEMTLDPLTVRRKIFNQRRPSVFQHIATFHHKFGIRHLILIGMLALYSVLGGLIFLNLESENELQNLETMRQVLSKMVDDLSLTIFDIANVTVSPDIREDTVLLINQYYREMLKVEGKYAGSVYHKYERITMRLTWTYSSAVFFAMTLFTTIGYGTIAAQTIAGKIFSVVYATIGIPLMLVVLSDVGRVLLRWFTKSYNVSRKYILRFEDAFLKHVLKRERHSYFEEKEFPLSLAITIMVAYLLFCALIITTFDYHDGITPGLPFGNALYFSFISMSTIGLGDIMPNNIEYSPILAIMFLFGLALLSVVNSTVYEKMESKFLHVVEVIEGWLQQIRFHRSSRDGYDTFKLLGPSMQLLALALPMFDDDKEDEIENKLTPQNTEFGQKMYSRSRKRTRTNSFNDNYIDNFRPALGIFGNVRPRSNSAMATVGSPEIPFTAPDPVPTGQTQTQERKPSKTNSTKMYAPTASARVRRVHSDNEPPRPSSYVPRFRTISELV